MLDILLLNVPQISLVYPPAATSLLKSICEHNGYTARVVDYNLQLYNECSDTSLKQEFDQYFSLNDRTAVLSAPATEFLNNFLQQRIDEILELNPRWIGISVFTFQCQLFTRTFLEKLRPLYAGKIVIGGAGISSAGIGAEQNDFGNFLLEQKLIDYYIRGEGDNNLIHLLQGDTEQPGINNDNAIQIDNLDEIPIPNYDDVISLPYQYTTQSPQLPVTGSRGCVRKCSFCDIHIAWKKYRYRSGTSIAEEFIQHYERFGVTNFWFTDSLINGSTKTFKEFCSTLLAYYKKHNLPERFFNWGGQWIVRDNRTLGPQHYELAARAGMNGVAMGVESLSEQVREHMKKGFSNADLDFTLEQFHKHNLNCYFLIIVGYPTETEANFEEIILKFKQYQKYALDGTIYGVNLGRTASIDEGTPLWHDFHTMTGQSDISNEGFDWIWPDNPTLTFKERIRRRIRLQEILMDLGYNIWNADSQLLKLKEAYDKIANRRYKIKIPLQIAA